MKKIIQGVSGKERRYKKTKEKIPGQKDYNNESTIKLIAEEHKGIIFGKAKRNLITDRCKHNTPGPGTYSNMKNVSTSYSIPKVIYWVIQERRMLEKKKVSPGPTTYKDVPLKIYRNNLRDFSVRFGKSKRRFNLGKCNIFL